MTIETGADPLTPVFPLGAVRERLYVWDDSAGEWRGVASEVDVEANSLTARLDHLATFAVLGRTETDTQIYLPMILKDD